MLIYVPQYDYNYHPLKFEDRDLAKGMIDIQLQFFGVHMDVALSIEYIQRQHRNVRIPGIIYALYGAITPFSRRAKLSSPETYQCNDIEITLRW